MDDGTSCKLPDGGSAQCASGICTSRDLQCKGNGIVNTVSACPAFSNECTLNCQDARGTCFLLNGNFLDGTPCGGTGKCAKGQCVGSNVVSQALDWIKNNPQFAWPIIILLALIVLMCLYSGLKRCCCRGKKSEQPQPIPLEPTRYGRSTPAHLRQSYPPAQTNNWVDPAQYNGPNYTEGQSLTRPRDAYNNEYRYSDSYVTQSRPSAPNTYGAVNTQNGTTSRANRQKIVQVSPGVFGYQD